MDVTAVQYHPTLVRQIRKFYGNLDSVTASMQPLLESVSQAYIHADEDRALMERSLEISSRELSETISELKGTFEANSDGILVVDGKGKILSYNESFIKMWQIPESEISSRSDDKIIEFILAQLSQPEKFLSKVKELYSHPQELSKDVLEFVDGRVFERNSLPLRVGDKITGRVWNFRDITLSRKAAADLQEKINELDKMNGLMVGRELRMIELKQEIKDLKNKLMQSGSIPA